MVVAQFFFETKLKTLALIGRHGIVTDMRGHQLAIVHWNAVLQAYFLMA